MGRGRRRRQRRKEAAKKAKEEETSSVYIPEETSSVYIPEEIVWGIVLLLPAEALLRFRCVSRRWCSFISPNIKQKVIFPYHETCSSILCGVTRCCLPPQGCPSFQSIDQTLSQIENIDIDVGNMDVRPCKRKAHVCGSCNGLLLIKIGSFLLLWDPSECCSKGLLPYKRLSIYPCENRFSEYPNSGTSEVRTHLGLCFDSHSNDYKVLLALEEEEGWDRCDVLVGSFKAKSWKRVELLFGVKFERSPCVVVRGYLHCLVYDKEHSCQRILCFDPKMDQFVNDLPLPEQPPDKNLRVLGVGALDGYLSIAHWECLQHECCWEHEYYCSIYCSKFEVSVMKQYGVGESWTLLFRFNRLHCWDHLVVPLFFTDERQVLMQIENGVVAYDTDKDMYKVVARGDSTTDDVAIVYEERATFENRSKTLMTTLEALQNTEEVDAMPKQVREVSRMPEQVWKAPPLRCGSLEVNENCTLPKQTWDVIRKGGQN